LRAFGKFFDTSNWRAGDLLLVRDIEPDWVGRGIEKSQLRGGYAQADARWSHAALYLGDRLTVCEATFSVLGGPQGVVQTPLWEYCGTFAVRLRRPRAVVQSDDAWLLAIKALTQLRKEYDFNYIARLAWLAWKGTGFWGGGVTARLSPSALVCSTLYADAYGRQTRRTLGEEDNGICTPAYLSQSAEFDDLNLEWLEIQ
jgi:hypothetical protein